MVGKETAENARKEYLKKNIVPTDPDALLL